jgi:hypothetical protein
LEFLHFLGVIFGLFISFVASGFEMAYVRIFPFFTKFSGYLHDRSGVLTAVLIWNTFALTLGTIYLYEIIKDLHLPYEVFISGILGGLLFAVFGELLPKTLSVLWTDVMFKILVYPFMLMYLLLRFLGITKLASIVVESKYSRDEVLDLTLLGFKDHLDEKDIRFIKAVISALHAPAKQFAIPGEDAPEKINENSTCLDALIFMRERGINRVKLGDGKVFDLHEFIRRISESHL